MLTSLELCAGGGGQALGLEQAGFEHLALFENDAHACQTLRRNRPQWPVFEHDLFQSFDFAAYQNVDLLAGGLPCPPFSVAGKQLGEQDSRNLFTRGVDIAEIVRPKAILFENVRGMLNPSFDAYRKRIEARLQAIGFVVQWLKVNASDFGVPQLRPRVAMVALQPEAAAVFTTPHLSCAAPTVGETLYDLMGADGWAGAKAWKELANKIAPTIVGGSKKHGGPDLGPTRARKAWAELGIDGRSIADAVPSAQLDSMPKLTIRMVARLQGFPDDWHFEGRKTAAYRQVGNAFPPPVAAAIATEIARALRQTRDAADYAPSLQAAE